MEDQPARNSTTIEPRRLDRGCALLYEMVAEAFDPHWREMLERMYIAMRDADLSRDIPKPWEIELTDFRPGD